MIALAKISPNPSDCHGPTSWAAVCQAFFDDIGNWHLKIGGFETAAAPREPPEDRP